MSDLFLLDGKNALVTGCAGGIGAGIAVGLAKAGADIIGLDLADLSETERKVRTLGKRFFPYRADLSEEASIDSVWNQITEEAGTVDILFNNAGMQHRESALSYPADVFDRVLAVNLRAPYLLAQKVANHLIGRKCGGKIINTASLFSSFGGCDVVGYTCSKHGVLGMTRALSNEFSRYGICVNAIAPGYIATDLTRAIWSDPEKKKPMDERLPIGRWGTPEDFEGVAVFLASHASDYITGTMIPVDGGYTAR
ncbi:SDR family oxidoreductase [Caproiciproducens sp. NJN-50]|uniref:SDR family oxidoreductase n=1 Tax=Caproiciproducens sp. NJN-50 TaxID=2507162 RepID=UPI000FFDF981|nr:SDR family oxidoreductase [Caproiciproducens sp. NJN-50]QAT48789.1 SDR family oxidoreductase [Caproiciproducens sp. NJN-50]